MICRNISPQVHRSTSVQKMCSSAMWDSCMFIITSEGIMMLYSQSSRIAPQQALISCSASFMTSSSFAYAADSATALEGITAVSSLPFFVIELALDAFLAVDPRTPAELDFFVGFAFFRCADHLAF
jgi:hypothetical protein